MAGAVLDWAASDGFSVYNDCPYVRASVAGTWQYQVSLTLTQKRKTIADYWADSAGATSGHSAQSGAATSVLTDMFGIMAFTDTTHTDHGLVLPQEPRSFNSFDEAAREAAVSRLYGGIRYSFENEGYVFGRCIGERILKRVRSGSEPLRINLATRGPVSEFPQGR